MNNRHFHSMFRQSNENVELLQQQRIREFESKEPEFQLQLDVEHIRCPSHLIQFNSALKILNGNQTLKISSPSVALISDLAASGRILECTVQTLHFRRQHFLYVTKPA